jgi:hypothetical protein
MSAELRRGTRQNVVRTILEQDSIEQDRAWCWKGWLPDPERVLTLVATAGAMISWRVYADSRGAEVRSAGLK